MPKTEYKKGDKTLLRAWAFYDWANSVYALVISTAIFPCLLYTSPSPRDVEESRMPSSA